MDRRLDTVGIGIVDYKYVQKTSQANRTKYEQTYNFYIGIQQNYR